jgi:hypothetical protein
MPEEGLSQLAAPDRQFRKPIFASKPAPFAKHAASRTGTKTSSEGPAAPPQAVSRP